jgi:hypothetical protein
MKENVKACKCNPNRQGAVRNVCEQQEYGGE